MKFAKCFDEKFVEYRKKFSDSFKIYFTKISPLDDFSHANKYSLHRKTNFFGVLTETFLVG